MTRRKRAALIAFLLVSSQLASGCCGTFRNCYWRWRCAPCDGAKCAPSYRVSMPPISTPPVASAPLFHGAPDCPTCATPHAGGYGPGLVGPGYVGPAGGIPTIGNPMPLGGPTVEPSRELPFPMPNAKDKN